MNAFEVVETLIGGMDAADKAKLAKILGCSTTPAKPQLSHCQRNGHAYRVTEKARWFSGPVLTCTKCGRRKEVA